MACARDNVDATTSDEMSDDSLQLIKTTAKKTDINDDIVNGQLLSDTEMKKAFETNGLSGIAAEIDKKLNQWKTVEINIAVTGRSGVGKSSFINAIRGDLTEDHPDYAEVGNNECTRNRKAYPHPENRLLKFWDLPGAGTERFPRKTYLENKEISFNIYDMFIIMACDRFTEDETWLAKEVKNAGKTFLFVRTKIDNQIDSDAIRKKKAGKEPNPLQVIKDIREDCEKNLENLGSLKDIYLINNNVIGQENLDFERLLCRVVDNFDSLKAEAFLFTIGSLTPDFLKKKIELLQKRVWGIGFMSSVVGAIPIPGTSLVVDAILINNETRLYREQLGLSDQHLNELAKLMNVPLKLLIEQYSLTSLVSSCNAKDLLKSSGFILSHVVDSTFKSIPVIGMLAGASISFVTTVKLLQSILEILENDAKKVTRLFLKHSCVHLIRLQFCSETE